METKATKTCGKKILKVIRNNLIMIVAGSLAGLLLLFLVHCIPVDRMAYHVWQSLPMIEYEFEHSSLVEDYPGSFIGNFTDCLMLENSIYHNDAHSTLEQTLFMYRGESGKGDGWAAGYSLSDYLNDVVQTREESYARYWHGYLVILKPLLYLMTFNSIRMLQAMLQLILAGFLIMGFTKRKNSMLGTAFLLSLPFMYFFTLYASLSLSICYYIMAVTLLIQMAFHDKIDKSGHYCEFFFLVGMATAYFDFLTYPIITIAFPMCVYLWLSSSKGRSAIGKTLIYTVEWIAGYGGLWAAKWIITDCLYGGGIIIDAIATVAERSASAGGTDDKVGFTDVLAENFSMFSGWGFYILCLGIFLWIIYVFVKKYKFSAGKKLSLTKKSADKNDIISTVLPYLFVGLYPFIWFFFTQNHSYEHSLYTCRIISASVFAVLCAVGKTGERR
jgi:hypothetical protein